MRLLFTVTVLYVISPWLPAVVLLLLVATIAWVRLEVPVITRIKLCALVLVYHMRCAYIWCRGRVRMATLYARYYTGRLDT